MVYFSYLILFLFSHIFGTDPSFSSTYQHSSCDSHQLIADRDSSGFVIINSIDPENENYADFEKIGESIGDATIVLLGEQSHGDKLSMKAKSRLVKYLHDFKGFDVVIFEADFFSITMGLEKNGNDNLYESLKENIYPFWIKIPVMKDFWGYIQSTQALANPILIGGIDPRHYGTFAQKHLIEEIDFIVDSQKSSPLKDSKEYTEFKKTLKNLLESEFEAKHSLEEQALFFRVLNQIKTTISQIEIKDKRRSFWERELKNLEAIATDIWSPFYFGSRERIMGDNFKWLYDHQFAGKKVIIWSHNQHIMKNREITIPFFKNFDDQADTLKGKEYFTELGEELMKRWKDEDVYSIAFISYNGSYSAYEDAVYKPRGYNLNGFNKKMEIPLPSNQSLESSLAKEEHDILFLDLKNSEHLSQDSFYAKVVNYFAPFEIKTKWSLGYDAFFFIETMEPFSLKSP